MFYILDQETNASESEIFYSVPGIGIILLQIKSTKS